MSPLPSLLSPSNVIEMGLSSHHNLKDTKIQPYADTEAKHTQEANEIQPYADTEAKEIQEGNEIQPHEDAEAIEIQPDADDEAEEHHRDESSSSSHQPQVDVPKTFSEKRQAELDEWMKFREAHSTPPVQTTIAGLFTDLFAETTAPVVPTQVEGLAFRKRRSKRRGGHSMYRY